MDVLFERYGSWLRRWARGRLPPWARGAVDTSDLVQDALHSTFARLGGFKSKQTRVLRIYLRRAIDNRIRDELRQVTRVATSRRRPNPFRLRMPRRRSIGSSSTMRSGAAISTAWVA